MSKVHVNKWFYRLLNILTPISKATQTEIDLSTIVVGNLLLLESSKRAWHGQTRSNHIDLCERSRYWKRWPKRRFFHVFCISWAFWAWLWVGIDNKGSSEEIKPIADSRRLYQYTIHLLLTNQTLSLEKSVTSILKNTRSCEFWKRIYTWKQRLQLYFLTLAITWSFHLNKNADRSLSIFYWSFDFCATNLFSALSISDSSYGTTFKTWF